MAWRVKVRVSDEDVIREKYEVNMSAAVFVFTRA